MNVYLPKPNRFAAATVAFIGIICAFGCGFAGAMLDKTLLFFCISCTLILFSFQMLFRFCFTAYAYEVEDGILYVKTGLGKKINTVFSLDLKLVCHVTECKKTKDLTAKYGEIFKRFNCCQNFLPKERYAVIYESGKTMAVLIECTSDFAQSLH